MSDSPAPRKRRSIGLRILVFILVLVGALYLALPTIVHRIANKELPKNLTVPATLGDVQLSLVKGQVGLRDLVIPQPDGFGDGNALAMGALDLKVDTGSLRAEQLVVNEIHLKDTKIHAVMDEDKELNFANLAKPSEEGPDSEGPDEEDPTPVLIERIHLENVTVTWAGNPAFPVRYATPKRLPPRRSSR